MTEYITTGTYDTREEAIVAALDELIEPGSQLVVHAQKCTDPDHCICKPYVWTYPK
jgi:hypothetical protein